MGSWNATCALTGLYIRNDDPVYIVMMNKNDNEKERCYTTAFWHPLPFLIESNYYDYGYCENTHADFNYVVEGLRDRRVIETDEVKKDLLSEKTIFEWIHEGKLNQKNIFRNAPNPIDVAFIRRDVVTVLLKEWKYEIYDSESSDYVTLTFQDLLGEMPELIKQLKEGIGPRRLYSSRFRFLSGLMDYRYSSIFYVSFMLNDLLDSGNTAELERILTNVLTFGVIDEMMQSLRKVWTPCTHRGSQDVDPKPYLLMNSIISNVLEAEAKRLEEEF